MAEQVRQHQALEKIGEGGVAAVYRVRHTLRQRAYALKKMRPELAGRPELRQRFLQETPTLEDLRHEGIIDLTASFDLLVRGCGLDDGPACNNLGTRHAEGRGVPVDAARAAAAFESACTLGEAAGCTEQGVALIEGNGVARDVQRAISLYERACQLGSKVGCKNLELTRHLRR